MLTRYKITSHCHTLHSAHLFTPSGLPSASPAPAGHVAEVQGGGPASLTPGRVLGFLGVLWPQLEDGWSTRTDDRPSSTNANAGTRDVLRAAPGGPGTGWQEPAPRAPLAEAGSPG